MTAPAPTTPTTAPSFDDESLNRIAIAEYDWPFSPQNGGPSVAGSVKFPKVDFSKLKVDQAKASGTDKAKSKINGVDCNKGTFELHWTRHIDDRALPMLQQLDPGGPRKGKPQEVRHPFFTLVSLHALLITEIEFKMEGDARSATFSWEEWNEPPTAVAGATTTPTDPSQWQQGVTVHGGALNGVHFPTVPKGFTPGSPSAPATSPS
jgi:hypothetical protein